MNKLDELFKEKLADYAVTPSGGAWQKVEAGLSKKNNTLVWVRWAAAFLIGGLLLGSLWLQKEESPELLVKKDTSSQQLKTEIQKSAEPVITEQKKVTKNSFKKKKAIAPASPVTLQEVNRKEEVAQVKQDQSPIQVQSAEAQTVEVAKVSPKISKSIVLTYTLGPVETPAEENTEPVEVAATDKKDNSLKRVVDFAKNVKNGDSPLGGIRDMKEDLFALDLRKKATSKNH